MSSDKIIYAQFVVGAPGAGKSSYCHAMGSFLDQIGRETLLIDLDPAHVLNISPRTSLSLSDLITVDQVMEQFHLGPNGALLYCMEWLEDNLDTIFNHIQALLDKHDECRYILFDLPGQIELYTNSGSIQRVLQTIQNEWKFRSVVVHLTDSVLCFDPSHYISSVLVSLSVMLNLQLPHVNVLSKVDLFTPSPGTPSLDFFDGNYLESIVGQIDRESLCYDSNDDDDDSNDSEKKNSRVQEYLISFSEINHDIVELIEDYSLVQLTHLSINDKYAMVEVLKSIDRANGYAFQDMDLQSMQMKQVHDTIQKNQQQIKDIVQRDRTNPS